MTEFPLIKTERLAFHAALLANVLTKNEGGIASNADKASASSRDIAAHILGNLGSAVSSVKLPGQTAGAKFEEATARFVERTFLRLGHLRPGRWLVRRVSSREGLAIADYEQFSHLVALQEIASKNAELAAALGNDYTIAPDIVIAREPEDDAALNKPLSIVSDELSTHAVLRGRYFDHPQLHASISCKWTLRSDRAQNARSEALNLIRNRKGRLPHIVVVTGEPLPSRLSSLALGTGDIDCVYHFALHELQAAVEDLDLEDPGELLKIMIDGKRLKDISDLPLDLAV